MEEVAAEKYLINSYKHLIFMVMKTKLFITGLAFMALTAIVAAQDNTRGQIQQPPMHAGSGNFVAADKNGICDYYETNRQFNRSGRRMGNAAATGNRRGLPAGQGRGLRPDQGRGLGPGKGQGIAPGGRYFVDENKNGICDLRETTPAK